MAHKVDLSFGQDIIDVVRTPGPLGEAVGLSDPLEFNEALDEFNEDIGVGLGITEPSQEPFNFSDQNLITQPESRDLTHATRREVGPAPSAPEFGQAPGITPPPSLTQTQQQVRGDTLTRLVKDARQLESTTGRAVTGEQIGQVAEGLFGAAADRAAQNKALAIQEFSAVNQLELQRFGLDSKNILAQANLKLRAHQFNVNTALNEFAQDLQAEGVGLDQAFRISQQSIDVQIQNEANRIQIEGIKAGLSIDQANARAQGVGTLVTAGISVLTLLDRED